MVLHLSTILLMMAQMPFYIVLAVKNDRLDQTKKIIWVVLFAVVAMFATPVYWYLHIWRVPKTNGDSESLPPAPNNPPLIYHDAPSEHATFSPLPPDPTRCPPHQPYPQ